MRKMMMAAVLAAGPVAAETLTFEAVEGVRFVRCYDAMGAAMCEIIAPLDARLQCVALDAEGEPVAASNTFGRMGNVIYPGLDVGLIADVKCRSTRR